MTRAQRLRDLCRCPIVVAPMAGGPTTVDLVVAASRAGALGFLAGGYKTPPAMQAEIEGVRAATGGAFGVNLFVPGHPTSAPDALSTYVVSLEPEAAALNSTVGEARWDDDDYAAKLDVLMAAPPDIVSFTFGLPSPDVVRALQGAGSLVAITVTTAAEAASAREALADCLCVQGSEAGAHRGSFINHDRPGQDRPLRQLLAEVGEGTDLPLIAAGGISSRDDVAAVLAAGATQAQVGTAFLRCTESGANPAYKAALADARFTTTAITRAFSGRRARSLVNGFMRAHGDAPPAYPEINNATRAMRAAAASLGDPDHMSLYAGEGFAAAQDRAAGEIVERLVSGLDL